MAHSNRKKLKDSRGGMTRNQLRKSKNAGKSGGSSDRLASTIRWMEENEEKKRMTSAPTTKEIKIVSFTRHKNTIVRRQGVIKRLGQQLTDSLKPVLLINEDTGAAEMVMVGLEDKDILRINNELKTLRNRI